MLVNHLNSFKENLVIRFKGGQKIGVYEEAVILIAFCLYNVYISNII